MQMVFVDIRSAVNPLSWHMTAIGIYTCRLCKSQLRVPVNDPMRYLTSHIEYSIIFTSHKCPDDPSLPIRYGICDLVGVIEDRPERRSSDASSQSYGNSAESRG
jgi:hypothetical protein